MENDTKDKSTVDPYTQGPQPGESNARAVRNPKPEGPGTQTPAASGATTGATPATQQPAAQQPATQQPATQQPATQQPAPSTMRVRMLRDHDGHQTGTVVVVSRDVGRSWIDAGAAEDAPL